MNDLELQLRQDLRRCDTEIEVTDDDALHAQHRFLRRRGQLLRRRRRWTAAGMAAAAVVAIAGGSVLVDNLRQPDVTAPAHGDTHVLDDTVVPPPDGQPPLTEDSVSGTYMVNDRSGWLWTFHDGRVATRNPGAFGDGSAPFPFSLSGTQMSWPTGRCTLETTLDTQGVLQLTVTQAPAPGVRGRNGLTWCPAPEDWSTGELFSLTRLSPQSLAGAALQSLAPPPEEPASFENLLRLRGAWLQEGTGRLLTLIPEGKPGQLRYELDDAAASFGAPDDQGIAVRDDRGRLILTSSRNSAGCFAGDSVALGNLAIWGDGPRGDLQSLTSRMEVSASADGCAVHANLQGGWVQVS